METAFHIAQVNIARAKAPTESSELAEFVALLEPVNALAEAAPGFVWRLQDDSGDAVSIRVFDDELIIINMSVWESPEALWQFAYRGRHVEVFRRRREWFEKPESMHLALWWIPAGHAPTTAEAKERLEHLNVHGPTPYAFTFKRRYEPAGV